MTTAGSASPGKSNDNIINSHIFTGLIFLLQHGQTVADVRTLPNASVEDNIRVVFRNAVSRY